MKTLTTTLLLCLPFLGCTSEESSSSTAKTPTPASQPSVASSTTPENARVWFIEPKDGAKVTSPFKAVFGVENMDLVKAGERAGDKTAGHHHVIVDGEAIAAGTVIPMGDPKQLHYGDARKETEIELAPGKHTLTMQFADATHASYGKKLSSTITIEVTK